MQSGIFENEGFITLNEEEQQLLDKARDLHAAIGARTDELRKQNALTDYVAAAGTGLEGMKP